eukprot:gene10500-8467_t
MQTQPANGYKWGGDPIENGLTKCSLEVCPLAVSSSSGQLLNRPIFSSRSMLRPSPTPLAVSSSSGLLLNRPTFSSRPLLRKVLAKSLPTSNTWEEILYAQMRTFMWDNLTLDAVSRVIDGVVEVQDKWYAEKRAAIDYFLDNSAGGHTFAGGGDWKLNASFISIHSGLEPEDAEEVMTAVWTCMQSHNQVEDFMVVNPWGVRAALHAAADKTTLLAMSRAFDRVALESASNTSAPDTSATVTSRKLLMLSSEEIKEMENTTQEILNFLELSVAYAYSSISTLLNGGRYESTNEITKVALNKQIQMIPLTYQGTLPFVLRQKSLSSTPLDHPAVVTRKNAGNRMKNEPPGASPNTTLVVTDIQSSTDLWEALISEVMAEALQLHNKCIRTTLLRHEGYESCTEGDSFIIAFHTARAAVSFSTDVQVSLMRLDWPEALLQNKNAEVVWLWQPSPDSEGLDSPFKQPVLTPTASVLTTIRSDRSFIEPNLSNELLVPKASHEESVDGTPCGANSGEFNIDDAPQKAFNSLSRNFSVARHAYDPPVDKAAHPPRISSGFLSSSRLGSVVSKSPSANVHSSWNDSSQSEKLKRPSKASSWAKKGQSASASQLNVSMTTPATSKSGSGEDDGLSPYVMEKVAPRGISLSQIDEHNPLHGETNPSQVHTASHTPRGNQLLLDPLSPQTDHGVSLYHALACGWLRVTEAEATYHLNVEREKGQAPSVEMAFRGLRVRIGIHSGGLRPMDISANGTSGRVGYGGYALAMAKAVEASAHGGQVLLSQDTFSQLDVPTWRGKPLVLFTGDHIVKDVVAAHTAGGKPSYNSSTWDLNSYQKSTATVATTKNPLCLTLADSSTGDLNSTGNMASAVAIAKQQKPNGPPSVSGNSFRSSLHNSAVRQESRLRQTSASGPLPAAGVDRRDNNRSSAPSWAIASPESAGQGNYVNQMSPKAPEKLPGVVDISEASKALRLVGVTTEDSNTHVSLYIALIPSLLCRLAFLPPVPRTPIQLSPGTLEAPIGQAAVVFMTVVGSKTLMAYDSELMKESIALAQLCATKLMSSLQHPAFMAEMSDEGLFLAAFSRSLDAISWAIACTEGMKRLPWMTKLLAHEQFEAITASELTADGSVVDRVIMRGLRLKAGVAWGPVHHNICVTTGRMAYRGRVMNRSARVMAMASSAEVLCTGAAYTQCLNSQRLRGGTSGNIRATQKGVFTLKGIKEPVRK